MDENGVRTEATRSFITSVPRNLTGASELLLWGAAIACLAINGRHSISPKRGGEMPPMFMNSSPSSAF